MYNNVNFINLLKHITKSGLYNTAALLWRFQSLSQSDELICECPVHLLGLTLAPQLNRTLFTIAGFAINRTGLINLRQQLLH